MKRVYLDYAATSPLKPEVLEAMKPYFLDKFGNPSSIHSFGQEARAAIDKAREQVAKFLNCKPGELIFTNGGTEADNLALRGIVSSQSAVVSKPHLVTSAIEHHAVLHTCQDLEKQGLTEVTYLPVDKYGRVSPEDVKKAIKKNTVLVSIMYANNEIGTIQPIREIGKMIEKVNRERLLGYLDTKDIKGIKDKKLLSVSSISNSPQSPNILFHTDAVQALGYLNCDVKYLHVDLLSLSAHKFGGPKGIGALYVKEGVPLKPIITGGGQEYKKRAGTENVPGIVGLGKAIEELKIENLKLKIDKIQHLRDKLINGVLQKIPNVILTGPPAQRTSGSARHPTERLPNSASFCIKYVEGESMLINLDLKGIAASTGSACTSGSLEPSHVLIACGFDHQTTQGSLRLTLGEQTTEEDIDYVLKFLPPIIEKLRKMSPFGRK